MGIEAIGRVASVAPVVASVGRMSMHIPERGFSVSKILNPFKAEAPKPQFRVADVIAEAESIVKSAQMKSVIARSPIEMRMTKQSLVRTPEPMIVRFPNPIGAPKVEAVPQSILQRKTESRPVSRVVRTTSIPAQRVIQTEQIVEEKKVVKENKKEEKNKTKMTGKQSVGKIKIVEAIKITQLRRLAIFEAAKKVKEEAEKKGEKVVITGKKLNKFLVVEFWKYISPLVGKSGKDGTINLTLKAIAASPARYDSLQEAQTELSKPVTEHIPLQQGEGSRIATVGEVREVLEGKEKESLKSQAPAEIVIKRVVNTETTLKSLGLEELFQKAA